MFEIGKFVKKFAKLTGSIMVHAKATPKTELVTQLKNAKLKEAPIQDLVRPDTEFVAHVK